VGTEEIPACNDSQYGFMAAPNRYGIDGYHSFIINEEGVIWSTENPGVENGPGFEGCTCGRFGIHPKPDDKPTGKKWTTDAGTGKMLCWPKTAQSPTPAGFKGLNGKSWQR